VPVRDTPGTRGDRYPEPSSGPAASSGLLPGSGAERPVAEPSRQWRRRWVAVLATADLAAVGAALVAGFLVRFGADPGMTASGVPYGVVGGLIGAGWLAGMAAADAYRIRYLGTGAEEYKRVATGTFWAWGVIAVACYAAKIEVARGFVLLALPLGLMLLLAGRTLLRTRLVRARARSRGLHRVLVVGDRRSAAALARQLCREPAAGFDVVGACLPDPTDAAIPTGAPAGGPTGVPTGGPVGEAGRSTGWPAAVPAEDLPALGGVTDIAELVAAYGIDTVAVAASSGVPAETVRRIGWALEGTGVDLVVAPSVADVAGPRVSVRPVSGLPLLHVDQPEFTGARRVAKSVLDRVAAVTLLALLGPALLLVATAIRATSRGPALFRQTRIGRDGAEFTVVKFRTMYADAEARRAVLAAQNETDGLLFKIHDDPRVTPLGRLLRRTSIDELPQLLNVLRGDMALVGPRPLPVKNTDFTGDVRRRLLVRPGITGLWQVNGRSRLSWEDSIQLDLYYVENWSISLDLAILLRTVSAVVRGAGAY
jgi:lipopolysaccharide/colanic/teichoic acid biosynthesis glycosyltransferase